MESFASRVVVKTGGRGEGVRCGVGLDVGVGEGTVAVGVGEGCAVSVGTADGVPVSAMIGVGLAAWFAKTGEQAVSQITLASKTRLSRREVRRGVCGMAELYPTRAQTPQIHLFPADKRTRLTFFGMP